MKIDFEPIGRRGECPDGGSLLDCARRLGVDITAVCAGRGTCHTCKVRVISGRVSGITDSERAAFSVSELDSGWRLACQAYPLSDAQVHVPAESLTTPQRVQVEGIQVSVIPEPLVRAYRVKLSPPSLIDLRADDARLLSALADQHGLICRRIAYDALKEMSPELRAWGWECQAAVRNDEVMAIGRYPTPSLGLAVDLGTTKVAGYLIDLDSGQTLAASGVMNPQISQGEDVISRLSRAMASPEAARELQGQGVGVINDLARDLSSRIDTGVETIVDAVVVGNTAMHHLLLGLPVAQLAQAPFVPAVARALDVRAREVGLAIAPGAYLHLLPNIAGFVGADHVAVLLANGVAESSGVALVIDIGTNTEVSLINSGRVTSVSCASGPAFEGGHIRDGMRAARGAIEKLRIVDNQLVYQTIEGAPPVGICGSGILDAVAELYRAGIIEASGRFREKHPRLWAENGERRFILVTEEERGGKPALAITQQDVREIQLAKAAIRTGIQALLEANKLEETAIGEVVIAGAFGSYIDLGSAVTIGMLPSLPLGRFRQVGNAAGMGAKLALISRSKRAEAEALAARVGYLELATAPNFMNTLVTASAFGEYRIYQGKRREL